MKTPSIILFAAAGLALFAGCETTGGIPARIQEKSAVYATLQRWEKKYIDKGIVAVGFTPDMIYMAVGHPTTVLANAGPDSKGELWIYQRYFPTPDAHYTKFGNVASESASQPATTVAVGQNTTGPKAPRSVSGNPSNYATGGPQGGSMEPSDMQSYTLYILFEDGKATKVGINPE